MANKKQINTKSCDRLHKLIKELNMTYADFGESVNLSEYTVRSCATGVRRLTEDNARIITQKYPIVRYEWLMGYDDHKTRTSIMRQALSEAQSYTSASIALFKLAGYDIDLWDSSGDVMSEEEVLSGVREGYKISKDNKVIAVCSIEEMSELVDDVASYAEFRFNRFLKKQEDK